MVDAGGLRPPEDDAVAAVCCCRMQVLQMRWSKGDLEELIDERVRYVSKGNDSGLTAVDDLLPHTNNTRGCAFDYIL